MKNYTASLFLTLGVLALNLFAGSMIGDMTPEAFAAVNSKGAAAISEIKVTSEPLTKSDEALLQQIANGGMMQLETSKVAQEMATRSDVKAFAVAEVKEQRGIGVKLQEIAEAKKIVLPADPDAQVVETVARLTALKGAAFDAAYVENIGVKGHENLKATMKRVQAEAKAPELLAISDAAAPVIAAHLQVAQAEAKTE
jgi:putative membrane protein